MTYSHSAADGLPPCRAERLGRSGRRSSVPATPIVIHHQPQMFRHGTALGRAAGHVRAETPGADQGKVHVRLAGKGRWPLPLLTLSPSQLGGCLDSSRHFFQFGHQPSRQGFADVPESHSSISVRRPSAGIKPSDGVSGDVPKDAGEFLNSTGERDVVS